MLPVASLGSSKTVLKTFQKTEKVQGVSITSEKGQFLTQMSLLLKTSDFLSRKHYFNAFNLYATVTLLTPIFAHLMDLTPK